LNEIQNQITQTPIEIALGIGEDGKTTARKLYEFLEMRQGDYARWYKSNILENSFAIENEDYEVLRTNAENPKGGRPTQDFKLSANFAKKLSMQGKTEKAEQARDYFIKVEDKLKEVATKGISHNVKQLTITSRDIATMTTGKNLHGKVVRNIKDCIAELSEMGFNTAELFIEDTYIGANKQENTQYLCTEKGCNCYANKLEPEARQKFINEFTERFENMRCIADGKPVRKLPKLICLADVEEKDPLIRLFKTDAGGIVLINDEVHSLTQDEIEQLSRFVPELEKYEIGKTQYIVSAFLRSRKKSGKLEEIASWGVKEKPEALLPDKAAQKPKRTSSRDDNAPFITFEQAIKYGFFQDNPAGKRKRSVNPVWEVGKVRQG